MLLSIIIPCYNMEKYVRRCYNSLAIQDNASDVEFIFVNDGSIDKTLEILFDIKSKDNRIILINQDNAGVSVARNRALEIAKGEYIYLLDPDDYLSSPHVINNIKSIIKEYKPDIIIPANNREIDDKIELKPLPFTNGMYEKNSLFKNCIIFPTQSQLFYRT